MLKLVDIKKDYVSGDSVVHALKGISVNFRRSEFVSVLGPSGCGKTTLLNIIGGLDDYSDGDLVIGDRSTKDFGSRDWDSYRNHTVGFVFQSYNLIPHLTILQNVELALTISGMPRKKKRELAENALIRVGLGGMFKKKPGQLSGGQMQRVAIARAIVGDPKTILADEPTGALDSVTSVQIMDLLAEISGDKLVIMVTHNPELARRYSTRIIELRDGEIVGDSDPYDGLPTMLSPVGAVDPRSPIEEYIDENAAEERAKDQEAQAEGEGQPEASEGEGEEPSEERSEGAKKQGKQKNKQDKFVALVSPEKPEKLKKRSGQPKEKRQRASMSLFTAIGLSARNLITKKTRTILTAIAGSIGIIGIALVLSMSNGFNLYMDKMEQEILTAMPVQIASTGVQIDVDEAMQMPTVEGEFPDTDTIRPYQPEAGWQGVEISANIITEEYVDYVRGLDKELVSSVKYRYTANMRLVREGKSAAEGSAANVATGTVKWQQLLWPEFMNSMYDVLAGGYPGSEEADELLAEYTGTSSWADGENYDGATARQAVLVIGSTNSLDVGILHELGIYPRYLQDSKYDEISFDEVLGTTFELVAPDNRYERAPAEEGERELFEEIGSPEKLLGKEGNVSVTVVGILRIKEGIMLPFLSSGIAYTEDLMNLYLDIAGESEIGRAQRENTEYNVLTGEDFTEDVSPIVTMASAYGITEGDLMRLVLPMLTGTLKPETDAELIEDIENAPGFADMVRIYLDGKGMTFGTVRAMLVPLLSNKLGVDATVLNALLDSAYTNALQQLGASDLPTEIHIYPKNFEAKDAVLEYLDAWNASHPPTEQVQYTDMAGMFSDIMNRVVGIVSYVLIAFSAISLIVSSVMIGIITYVSVLERTTEIGVLRSLGARKLDVANLFNAETGIIGAISGILGVVLARIIILPFNAWIGSISPDFPDSFAVLDPVHAVILVALSIGLTVLSGLIPAMLAARKDPVKALRASG